jgi:hypothetical protein
MSRELVRGEFELIALRRVIAAGAGSGAGAGLRPGARRFAQNPAYATAAPRRAQ